MYSFLLWPTFHLEHFLASRAPENATITKSPAFSSSVVSQVRSTGPSSDKVGLLAKSSQNLFLKRNKHLTFVPNLGGPDSFFASSAGKRRHLILDQTEGGIARMRSSAQTVLPLMPKDTPFATRSTTSTGDFRNTIRPCLFSFPANFFASCWFPPLHRNNSVSVQ